MIATRGEISLQMKSPCSECNSTFFNCLPMAHYFLPPRWHNEGIAKNREKNKNSEFMTVASRLMVCESEAFNFWNNEHARSTCNSTVSII
jgi:hypothetical protein